MNHDNIDKDYLTFIIKTEMEKFGYGENKEMLDRIYDKIYDLKTSNVVKRTIMPSFIPIKNNHISDEHQIILNASATYDHCMERDASIIRMMEEIKEIK
jgi:hypothetical protein